MSGLAVPSQQQSSGKTISRSGSASSLRPNIEHEDDLAPLSRSRRNSESNAASGANANPTNSSSAGAPGSAAAYAGLIPLPAGPMQSSAENAALTSRVDWSEPDQLQATDLKHAMTSIYVGKDRKPFHAHTSVLIEKSPYFKRVLGPDPSKPASVEQTSFDDLDEFAMSLFLHWLASNGHLNGPHDFHSLAHYLSLYVLAQKFEIEGLENQVMDSVRHYYADQNMTAPAYRLEYIYTYTHKPNHMRTFLVSTAAFRALEETPHPDLAAQNPMLHKTFYASGSHVSDSIKSVLAKNPDMAIDFIEELVSLKRTGEHDARHGPDCKWHVHEATPKCKAQRQEPWQNDGADDEKPADKLAEDPKPEEKKPEPSPAPAPEPKSEEPKKEEVKKEEVKKEEVKKEEVKKEEVKQEEPKKDATVKKEKVKEEVKKEEPKKVSKKQTWKQVFTEGPKPTDHKAARPFPSGTHEPANVSPELRTPGVPVVGEHKVVETHQVEEHHEESKSPSQSQSKPATSLPTTDPYRYLSRDRQGRWRSETQRVQWEKTERALAKNEEGVFKRLHDKVKGHWEEAKDKFHKKHETEVVEKPAEAAPPAAPDAAKK